MMHIYAFGSICRGDVLPDSDVDLLAVLDKRDSRFNPEKFSIYSYKRLTKLWKLGNAFAWHLALESRLLFAEDGADFVRDLGLPAPYTIGLQDCLRFLNLYTQAAIAIRNGTPSVVFELSTIFLAIRNIATCYSLAKLKKPTFGRDSARQLGASSIPINGAAYTTLMRARILSTRGSGEEIEASDFSIVLTSLSEVQGWMEGLCLEMKSDG